jgi:hypothetical protein
MPAATHGGIAGHPTATWNGLALGLTDEGFFIEINHKGEVVQFEEYSANMVDMIHQGADVYVETILKEWNAAGLQTALWYHSATFGKLDCAGAELSVNGSFAKPLVLTSTACTPAADTPTTITFHAALMAPEVASRINFNNDLRVVPIRFNVFLTNQGTAEIPDYRYFTIA